MPLTTTCRGSKQLPTISEHLTAPWKSGNVRPSNQNGTAFQSTQICRYAIEETVILFRNSHLVNLGTKIDWCYNSLLCQNYICIWTSLALLFDFSSTKTFCRNCLIITHCGSTSKSSEALQVITRVLLPQVRRPLRAGSWYTMLSFIHAISYMPHIFYIHTLLLPQLPPLRKGGRKTFKTDLQKLFDSCVASWSIFPSIKVTWLFVLVKQIQNHKWFIV